MEHPEFFDGKQHIFIPWVWCFCWEALLYGDLMSDVSPCFSTLTELVSCLDYSRTKDAGDKEQPAYLTIPNVPNHVTLKNTDKHWYVPGSYLFNPVTLTSICSILLSIVCLLLFV